MSTTNVPVDVRTAPIDTSSTVRSTPPTAPPTHASRAVAALRIATGFVFLWAFLDKLIGLGYSTTSARSWLSGGSPTNGFLGHVVVGPFQSMFRSWAGAAWADVAFMAGLAAVGIAVMLGVALRLSAVAGAVLMLMMWAAEWPLARFTSAGDAAGSTNPLVDYHIVYALALIVVAATAAGNTWGLGRRWANLPVVRAFSWLR